MITLGATICLWARDMPETQRYSLLWNVSYLEKIALTKLIVEDVWFDNSSRVLRIFIANIGELESIVDSVIVDGRL